MRLPHRDFLIRVVTTNASFFFDISLPEIQIFYSTRINIYSGSHAYIARAAVETCMKEPKAC